MSNRQARREQARTTRTPRPRQTPGGSRRSSGGSSGGGSNIFSPGFIIVAGAAVVVAVAALVLFAIFGGNDSSSSSVASALEKAKAELPLDMANGTKLGKDDAPVKIVEYEDFQCPFCLEYTGEQEPAIINDLVKAGKVQLEYKNLPILGTESVSAAQAGLCAADQNKFWEYHNLLFTVQAKADQIGNEKRDVGRFSNDNLKKYASDVGIDRSKFDPCLDGGSKLDTVTTHQREATQFGITGTPGFVVNGSPIGAGTPQGIDAWKKIVDNVISVDATGTAGGNVTPSTTASASGTAAPAGTPSPAATATKAP
jgi:protein-disulfide isomerase